MSARSQPKSHLSLVGCTAMKTRSITRGNPRYPVLEESTGTPKYYLPVDRCVMTGKHAHWLPLEKPRRSKFGRYNKRQMVGRREAAASVSGISDGEHRTRAIPLVQRGGWSGTKKTASSLGSTHAGVLGYPAETRRYCTHSEMKGHAASNELRLVLLSTIKPFSLFNLCSFIN
jgi:hypothetical protein